MIDQDMNIGQIRTRRLQIAVELAELAERDCEMRRQMLAVETLATGLHREMAELDLLERHISPSTGEKR